MQVPWRLHFHRPNTTLRASGQLNQNELEAATNSGCRSLHCVKLDFVVLRVEQFVEVGAACAHAPRHFDLGDALLLHGLFDLPREDALDRVVGCVFLKPLGFEEIIERRANVGIAFHRFTSFCRARAKFSSDCGVFCVFLMKAWSRIM